MSDTQIMDTKPAVKPGNYPLPDGRTHHVLEVQNGTIDITPILERFAARKAQEVQHG